VARQARHDEPHEKEASRRARIAIKPACESRVEERARRAKAPRNTSLERGKTGERPPIIRPTDAPRVRQAESMLICDKRSHCAA
jgi:hypothetical protein